MPLCKKVSFSYPFIQNNLPILSPPSHLSAQEHMSHADHTRDPWQVHSSRCLTHILLPSQPVGHPQRLWRCFLYGCSWWRHMVWHKRCQKFSKGPYLFHLYSCNSDCLTFLQGERFVGAISSMKARAPVTGGNFGVWGGMFSTFDCVVKGWRQKEDAWNAIISGFMTGGCLALRSE